jgi:hypothetical protein
LHHDLKPPHDTRHDTRLPILTEVDRSMNPLAKTRRHDKDSRFLRKAGLLWECFKYNYTHPGSVFIPCHCMTPNGLRAQYLIPNLSLSAISYPSIRPFRSSHVSTQIPQNQREQIPCRTEANCRPRAPLPNLSVETFLLPDGFLHQAGPATQTPSCAKFWC